MRKILFSPPTLRLNTTIIISIVMLLAVSMGVIFYQSRQTLEQEAEQNAEKTLEAVTLQAENVLTNVEQTTGNIYWDLRMHLNDLDRMKTYTQEIVQSNPNIYGCAIAFNPKALGGDLNRFLAYTHRKTYNSSELITSDRYSKKAYMEQTWYLAPVETGQVFWTVPKKDRRDNDIPLMLYCIPIRSANSETVAVIAVEVSMDLFSQIVQEAKPSPNSYCMLLDSVGSYIVHPNRNKLKGETVFTTLKEDTDADMGKIANAMLSGEVGNGFYRTNGKGYRAFYRPFLRTNQNGRFLYNIKWSIALIYPEEDITSSFVGLLMSALSISAVGLLLFFLLTRIIISHHTKPLRNLIEVAEEIAEGNYDEEIPKSNRMDEIGEFQSSFKHMQEALLARISEQDKLTSTLQERLEQLRQTYEQIKEDDHVKTDLLHNMTNQMLAPARAINESVNTLCDDSQNISLEQAQHEVETIRQQRESILEVLNHLFNIPENEVRKEDSHE